MQFLEKLFVNLSSRGIRDFFFFLGDTRNKGETKSSKFRMSALGPPSIWRYDSCREIDCWVHLYWHASPWKHEWKKAWIFFLTNFWGFCCLQSCLENVVWCEHVRILAVVHKSGGLLGCIYCEQTNHTRVVILQSVEAALKKETVNSSVVLKLYLPHSSENSSTLFTLGMMEKQSHSWV